MKLIVCSMFLTAVITSGISAEQAVSVFDIRGEVVTLSGKKEPIEWHVKVKGERVTLTSVDKPGNKSIQLLIRNGSVREIQLPKRFQGRLVPFRIKTPEAVRLELQNPFIPYRMVLTYLLKGTTESVYEGNRYQIIEVGQ